MSKYQFYFICSLLFQIAGNTTDGLFFKAAAHLFSIIYGIIAITEWFMGGYDTPNTRSK